MKMIQSNFEGIKKSQELERKNNEAARKIFETQIGQIARKLAVPKATKKGKEVVVEEVENGVVEKIANEVIVEKENDHGVVENEKNKKNDEGEKSEPLIDVESILKNSKSQLLKDGDKPQEIPSYVKLPYLHLSKQNKKEDGQFKKVMELFSQLQKLPHKLKDPGGFTIPCTIGKVSVGRTLCNLRAIINLMHISMMKKLGCGEPKPTRMTLTLVNRTISYPYGVLEDVLVQKMKVCHLFLGRPFLATGLALIDVELGELMLRFQNEQVVFNIFEAMKHQIENPQHYRVVVVDEIVEDNSCEPQPTQPMEKTFVNSIDGCDKDEDLEVKEFVEQLEPSKQEVESLKIEDLLGEKTVGAQLSKNGEKNPEFKELLSHLKYVFLSKDASKPEIISNTLTPLEEEKLMRVLRDKQGALGWTISDLKGISPAYCMHKIHLEVEYKLVVQPQRRLNPTMKEVVKKEVLKLLDAGMIYPISESTWVSPVHVVPKKGGMTVVANEKK
ncbi:hypothetical protein MTR_3g012210 [Medicago truncatula]|uniref:Transposon Ty3-I Gag-Pol polyprotein n=1 Tax=Medicago truncatula TaxID=3880 RepID=A0A072UTM0_MEDTR|nr:hypothetical protein MTR_3g012210 [Medicago truncatula]